MSGKGPRKLRGENEPAPTLSRTSPSLPLFLAPSSTIFPSEIQSSSKGESNAAALHAELDELLEAFLDETLGGRLGLDSMRENASVDAALLEAEAEADRIYFDIENFHKTLLLQSNNAEVDVSEVPMEMLPNHISELERELAAKEDELFRQSAQSLQMQSLVDRVVEAEAVSNFDEETSILFRRASEFEQRKTLEVVELKRKLLEIRDACAAIQREIQRLRVQNRDKYRDVKARREPPPSEETRQEVEQLKVENRVLRHVFMKVVLGSGVNWAEDPTLRDIFLSCGDETESM